MEWHVFRLMDGEAGTQISTTGALTRFVSKLSKQIIRFGIWGLFRTYVEY
jgi:hypothetical protein